MLSFLSWEKEKEGDRSWNKCRMAEEVLLAEVPDGVAGEVVTRHTRGAFGSERRCRYLVVHRVLPTL